MVLLFSHKGKKFIWTGKTIQFLLTIFNLCMVNFFRMLARVLRPVNDHRNSSFTKKCYDKEMISQLIRIFVNLMASTGCL